MGDEWLQRISRRKNIPYYFNPRTGVTQWTKPSTYKEETCRDETRAVSKDCEERSEGSSKKKAKTSVESPVESKPSSIVNCSPASKPTSSKKCDQDTQASSSSKKSDQDTPAKSENEEFVRRVLKPRKRLKRKKKPSTSSDVPQKKFQEVKQSLPPDKSSSLKGPPAKCTQTGTVGTSAKCTQSAATSHGGRKETARHERNVDVSASERNGKQNKTMGCAPLSKERTVLECDSDTHMEVDLPLSTDGKVLVVVDTNVLINSLQYLGTIKGKRIEDLGDVMLTIPWIVMQELDLLKGNNYVPMTPLSASARKALSFLHKNRTDPNIKGQSYHHFVKTVKEKDVKGTSDDKILHYCLQCKKKYPMNLVVLLSNDKNLCVKSSFSGVPSSGDKNFLEEIKKQVRSHSRLSISSDDNELFSPVKDQPSSGRSSPEGAITCISPMECPSPEPFQSSDHGAFKGIKTTCKDSERTKTPSALGKQSDADIISNQQVGKTKSRKQERPSTSGSPCVSDQAKEAMKEQKTSTSHASDPVAERKKKEKEFTSKIMAFLKLALAIVLRHEMMECYTDHWLEIVHKKPPWSLLDALQCIKKHYIAVFGLLLGRCNAEEVDTLISIVEKIGEDESFTLKQLNSFLSATKAILMPLNKTAKYKDITMKCEDDIKRIYNQWKEMIKKDPRTISSPVINQTEKITLKIEKKESVQESEDMCVSPIATSSANTPDLGLLIDNQEARRQVEERTEGDGMDGVTYCVLSAFEAIYIVLKYHRDVIVWSFKHLASGCPIEGLPTKDESLKYLALALPLIEAIVLSLQRLIGSCLPVPVVHCAEVVESLQAYVKTLKLDLDISGLCPEMLQQFIVTDDNRERLVVGSQQLSEVLQQLHECRVTLSQF